MEIRSNQKGLAVYATKYYKPWDIIHREDALFRCCLLINDNHSELATNKSTKEKFYKTFPPNESFDYKFLSFITTFPEQDLEQLNPLLKFTKMFLNNKVPYEQVKNLSKTTKVSISHRDIKALSRKTQYSITQIKDMTNVIMTNKFEIHGNFGPDIGSALFINASRFNHSCNPNAFALVLYNKIIIYARRAIQVDEEITIPYGLIYLEGITNKFDFKCECGHCDDLVKIPIQINHQIENLNSSEKKIEYLMFCALTAKDKSVRTGYIQLLLEYYFDLWQNDKLYREEQLYTILTKLEIEECLTWITGKLLALVLAYKRKDKAIFNQLWSDLQFIISDPDIIEHIKVCIEIMPHSYNLLLNEILQNTSHINM